MEHGAAQRAEKLHGRGFGEGSLLSFGPGSEQSGQRSEAVNQDVAPAFRSSPAERTEQIR
jgi:hypothetical protein